MKRLIALFVCLLMAGAVQAQNSTMLNFTGFLYESDNTPGVVGFPPSEVGDVLAGVGYIESLGPEIAGDPDWDTSQVQLTWHMYDCVSQAVTITPSGMHYILYANGKLDLVADRYSDPGHTEPQYGFEPPNATSPATFQDGQVYLHGEFFNFYMTYHPTLHVGSFEGYLFWTGGTQLNLTHPDPQGYTVSGTTDPFAAPVPDGYDLEAVGQILFDPLVETQESTWGQVKNLYR
jgi:hypothetical protein